MSRWCVMAESGDPWAKVIEAATENLREIDKGDIPAARDALQNAAIGLRDVLAGRLPDPLRRTYLQFLLQSLEQIERGVDPRKALGLWGSNRIHRDRDHALFLRVGQELDRLRAQSGEIETPVARAIQVVAKQTHCGRATVEKAWKIHGGEDAWIAAKTL